MSESVSLEMRVQNEEAQQQQSVESTASEQYSDSEESSGVITPKLTRTLSLPRLVKQDENNINKTEVINISTSDPSHLFWVPASQHPEISPMEFQKYLQTNGVNLRQRSSRKRLSVLSVSYTPPLIDEEQKDEQEEEEEHFRKHVLRKSVSLDFQKVNYNEVPDFLVFDRNSSPLDQSQALVPKGDRPLLRRGARTNFKRNSTAQSPILSTRKSDSDFSKTLNDETSKESTINTSDAFKEKELMKRDSAPPLLQSLNNKNTDSYNHQQEQYQHNNIHTILEEEPVENTFDNNSDIPKHKAIKGEEPIRRASNRKTWSWTFWSDEKSKKNKVDPSSVIIKPQPSKSTDTALSSSNKRFTFSQLFSKKSKLTPSTLDPNTETNILLSAPKDFQLNQPQMFMTRLPLHVERAIYKLSHLKLANPRRPLHEQVLISNHMFWYLSIVSTTNASSALTTTALNETNVPKKPRKLVKKSQRPKQTKKKNFSHPENPNKAFMRHSTGFVVPDNYLHPANNNSNIIKNNNNNSTTTTAKRQVDSSSSSEEDEEPDDLDDVDKDEIPLAMYKSYKS
ncbi:hypothetical protein K501DRAFT_334865 [Backusella circina FSU 941]|nr:hypothetical protein K501DRAFT_334865 [Backusella circina FSU 941]